MVITEVIGIEIKDVTKIYENNCVLDIKELKIPSKGFVVISGDSGSGKTTLLNVIGLLDCANTGTITLFDDVVSLDVDLSTDIRKKYIGYMFQDDILLTNRTVKDNIMYPLEISGSANGEEKYYSVIRKLGIENLINRYPRELSRGQRQRIALARAIIDNKKIILADEPTGNLDMENSKIVFEFLKDISKDRLVVIATHNMELAKKYADRVIQLVDGRIMKDIFVEEKEYNYDEVRDMKTEKKKRQDFLILFKHALCDVKNELKNLKKVFVSGALMTIILVLTLATFVNSKREISDLENNYFGKNYLCLLPNIDYNLETTLASRYSLGHYLGDCSFLDNNESVEEYVKYYDCSISMEKGLESYPVFDLTAIKCNEFFESKINYLGIEGAMIKEDDEIILAGDIAEWYFGETYEDHIGERVTFTAAFGKYEFQIVGFNNKKDVNGSIQTYMTEDAIYNIARREAIFAGNNDAASIYGPCCYEYAEYDESGIDEPYIVGGEKMAEITTNTNGLKVMAGQKPTEADEVMVSDTFLKDNAKDLFGLIVDDSNINSKEFLEKYIWGTEVYVLFDYVGTINKAKVVGIFESSNDYDIVVSDMGLEQLHIVYPCQIDLFLKDNADSQEIITEVYNAGFLYEQPYEDYKDGISERFYMLKIAFGVIAIIVAILLVMVINTFTANNVHNCKKDIGLLMAMGMRINNIRKIYIIESFLIGLITEIIVVIILLLFKGLLQISWDVNTAGLLSLLNFGYIEILIAVLIGICVFSLAAIPAVNKNTRLTPKEAIYY